MASPTGHQGCRGKASGAALSEHPPLPRQARGQRLHLQQLTLDRQILLPVSVYASVERRCQVLSFASPDMGAQVAG
jgi:hypothetical protein